MELEKINGTENILLFKLDSGEVIDSNVDENIQLIINNSNITVLGSNNTICFKFGRYEDIEKLLTNKGFNILIVGDNNRMNIGRVNVGYHPAWGITGLNIIIGGFADDWSEPGINRTADNCLVEMGDNIMVCGAMIYLQESDSVVRIGDNSMISWGVDIWCTDVHTITDMEGNAQNFGKSIEIGRHVWVGKDSKIGKNVRIVDNSIIGWGSIVTRSVEESNVVIAGNPAKVVKRNINWDSRCLNRYVAGINMFNYK